MYNKIKITKFLIAFFVFSLFTEVSAQGSLLQKEAITSFVSTVKVNTDSSVDVEEIITYTTGQEAHHGIYRDIRPVSSVGGKMKISNVRVVNENGDVYNFTVSSVNNFVRIKIGDANRTFSGQKKYHISYHASNAVAHLQDRDELYWNTTGNEWGMPIYQARVDIILPNGLLSNQNACYFGVKGSTNRCQLVASSSEGLYVFTSPKMLYGGEGFTVAVGFPKGIVVPYQESFAEKYGALVGSIVFFLAFFTIMFIYWFRNWRDPKGTGVIVPQYDVPNGLTPMEVDGIVNEKINAKSISAEIIYLATLGYIKIRQVETVTFKIFKSKDYEIFKLKDILESKDGSSVNGFDLALMSALFGNYGSNVILLSSLKNNFYKKIPLIVDNVADDLLGKMYYKNLGKINNKSEENFIVFIGTGICISGFIFFFLIESPLVFFGIVSLVVCFVIFWYLSPAKTKKGVTTKEYLLGLKRYLQIAEKNRLDFHNAPEKKPEVFEKLLPFAMVLGVEKAWAKEFKDIYVVPPTWYEGTSGTDFSSLNFISSLSDFSSTSSSLLSSVPESSGGGSFGSDGGGFSGGGGGGGGGGSW